MSVTGSKASLALAAVAIVIAAIAATQTFSLGAQTSDISTKVGTLSTKVDQQATAVQTLSAQVGPKTQRFKIIMGEGEVIAEVGGEDVVTGEYHRWEPGVIVVKKGDTVALETCNPRKNFHSFVLTAYGIDTGLLEPRTGCKTVEFVADKTGIFQYQCGTPHNHELGHCDPDHATMVGYLVVLE